MIVVLSVMISGNVHLDASASTAFLNSLSAMRETSSFTLSNIPCWADGELEEHSAHEGRVSLAFLAIIVTQALQLAFEPSCDLRPLQSGRP